MLGHGRSGQVEAVMVGLAAFEAHQPFRADLAEGRESGVVPVVPVGVDHEVPATVREGGHVGGLVGDEVQWESLGGQFICVRGVGSHAPTAAAREQSPVPGRPWQWVEIVRALTNFPCSSVCR
jgi:hypothetical protein